MSEGNDDSAVVDQIARELADCRQRGLQLLDRSTRNQTPIQAPQLQGLAQRYVTSKQLVAPGRISQIQILLRQALEDLSRQGQDADARLIRDLFFGDSTQTAVIMHAGELLDLARRNSGEPSEARFRERRVTALRSFAAFLVQFVDGVEHESNSSDDVPNLPPPAGGVLLNSSWKDSRTFDHTYSNHLHVTTGYVGENVSKFVQLLSEANKVTIIGFTHEQLTAALSEALELKRTRDHHRPDAFWNSLRIVFLSETLLDYVNDERDASPDRQEAVRERRRAMTWGRRSVRLLLRHTLSTRWALFESPFLPPFAGTLFEISDRNHIVQLLIRRPQSSTTDNLYFEFDDLDGYFTDTFEDVVRNSINDNRAVPIGIPHDTIFQCRGKRFRQNILRDGSDAKTWLPMILIVTTRRRERLIEPMLQVRTEDNAVRELYKISHLSGHIFQEDHSRPFGAAAVSVPPSFDLATDYTVRAAQRRVQLETGDDTPPALRPVTTGRYLSPDKENLFFFVYALDLPDDFDFSSRSEMHHFPLPELLAIRANHTLRVAEQLCQRTDLPSRLFTSAAEIVSLNLRLHDYHNLGQKIMHLAEGPPTEVDGLLREIRQWVEQTTSLTYTSSGNEMQITGLSGWQYREFFNVLIPLYAEIGIPGAGGLLDQLSENGHMRAARDRLARLYQDEDLMRSLPIEL